MIIKKWNTANGGSWEEQYPKTLETMIYDSNATTTPIFDNGKLKQAYLPDSVFGGMVFVGTAAVTGTPSSPLPLDDFIDGTTAGGFTVTKLDTFTGKSYTNGDYAGIGQRYIGHYWVISTSGISVFDNSTSDEVEWNSAVFDDGVAPATSGSYQNLISLEPGDWLIISGWDNANSRFKLSVISNGYQSASTSNKGIVELATTSEVTTGTSTTLIASVKEIKDNYAAKVHQHDETDIDLVNAYSNIGTSVGDTLETLLLALDSDVGDIATNTTNISTNTSNIATNTSNISTNASNISTNTSNISTNTTDIGTLEGRKEVFVQASAPTANQANDIWFDI